MASQQLDIDGAKTAMLALVKRDEVSNTYSSDGLIRQFLQENPQFQFVEAEQALKQLFSEGKLRYAGKHSMIRSVPEE